MKQTRKTHSPWRGIGLSVLLAAAMLLIPVGTLLGLAFGLPDQYANTFTAALTDKAQRLREIDDPKIVVIGGSSIAFGLDSQLMERETGMPTVNFGLYASLGTRAMLDLSRPYLGEGDVVLLSPETDAQTLSGFFGGEVMWQATERDRSLLRDLSSDAGRQMVTSLWDYTAAKCRLMRTGTPDPTGVYRRGSFDAYGDLSYPRPASVMPFGFDPGQVIKPSADLVGSDFVELVNEYVAYARERGAEVYFTYAPMNAAALSPDTTDDSLYDYYLYLCSVLDCEVITDVRRAIMEPGYFYDSNFHLNDAGRTVWTAHLCEDVRRVLGVTAPMTLELPAAPALPSDTPIDPTADPNAAFFVCRAVTDAAGEIAWYTVEGLTEAGRTQTELTVPRAYEGVAVRSIEANAFRDSRVLTDLYIPDSILSITSGAFAGCPTLARLHLSNTDASTMVVDQMSLFDGANPAIRLMLHGQAVYESFVTDYFWGNYAGKMVLVSD